MRLISHRGNIRGKKIQLENEPSYIDFTATKLAEITKTGQEFAKKQQEMAAEFQNLPADVQTKIGEYFTAKSNELMEAMKAQ